MSFRFTKNTIPEVLRLNEGFDEQYYYSGKNASYTNRYKISDGKVFWKQSGKTSWADSRYENEWEELDDDRVHSFLYNHKNDLILPE